EPPILEQAGKAPLRGGRIRWRFRAKPESKLGDCGTIIVTITRPDGSHISDSLACEVLAALEEKAKKEKGFVPPFKIVPINPYDQPEQWASVWPDLDPTLPPGKLESVAYRPVNLGGVIHVFYSTIFTPFKAQSEKLKNESAALSESFRNNYEI